MVETRNAAFSLAESATLARRELVGKLREQSTSVEGAQRAALLVTNELEKLQGGVEEAKFGVREQQANIAGNKSAVERVARQLSRAEEGKGRETVAQLREVDPSLFETFAKTRLIEDSLAIKLGRNISEVFYEHERVDLGENLGIR